MDDREIGSTVEVEVDHVMLLIKLKIEGELDKNEEDLDPLKIWSKVQNHNLTWREKLNVILSESIWLKVKHIF